MDYWQPEIIKWQAALVDQRVRSSVNCGMKMFVIEAVLLRCDGKWVSGTLIVTYADSTLI